MKANELRIGNWCASPYEPKIFKVSAMHILHLEEGMDSLSILGIPLTPEIFYNSGFDEKNTKWRKLLKNGKVSIDMSHYGQTTFWYCYGNHGVIGLDYVHQLQNLYFALTGKELNIEL